MSSISFVSYVADSGDISHSHITDLTIVDVGGVMHLYSGTRYDGVLRQWVIDDGSLAIGDSHAYQGGDRAGGVAGFVQIEGQASPLLITGGGDNGALQTVSIRGDGSFGTFTPLSALPNNFAGFQAGTAFMQDNGTQIVFGALAGTGGLGQMRFDSVGTFMDNVVLYDPAPESSNQITATAAAKIGTEYLVVTASGAQNGVTARQIDSQGEVSEQQTIGAEAGLWISAPTALEIAVVGASTYAVLGAAGTDSLSVIEIGADGAMIVRDHILDARDTRFGGVTSLEIVQTEDKTYVIAGGADDGVSVFVLLEGGLLVHRASIEDTDDFGLDNISALAGRQRAAALDIFVASSSETGVTQLQFDTGLAGITATANLIGGMLTGTSGGDILQGHDGDDLITAGAGDDIIRDGQGSDIMTGGAGDDLFILSADGNVDTITDFTVGEDKIDLSLWPMLRDISQLFINIEADGMRITYGQEDLLVQSASGGPIDYRTLSTTDLIGASRLPFGIEPGYPGPATPIPSIGEPAVSPPANQGGPNSILTPLQKIAASNIDSLRDDLNAGLNPVAPGQVIDGRNSAEVFTGSAQSDLIMAGGGSDIINAMDGDDTVLGRAGADQIDGGDGADTLLGGTEADVISGGNGQDMLDGGDGADRLAGGAGDDVLFGREGADTFIFNAGSDLISDFEQGIDQIVLDPGLWTGLTSAADLLFVYGSFAGETATIDFGAGNILRIDGVTDQAAFADDIALF